MRTILIVDDEENVRYSFRKLFRNPQTDVIEASNGLEALNLLKKSRPDLVLMDIEMPVMNGLEAIQRIKQQWPSLPVIIMTAFGTTERVIAAMKYGAFEYLEKPFDVARLKALVEEALETARPELLSEKPQQTVGSAQSAGILGQSAAIKEVYKMIGRVAASDVSVLITGESGTGKELVAKAIHEHSERNRKAFVAINCAAIPDNLLESELFGFEKGAFTDASVSKAGKFEQADAGTLFLDEIGDMSLNLQAKLLRVIQEGTFERLGSNKTIKVDVRLLSATNKQLEAAIQSRLFREDLFYRLKVISITLPPLRMRKDDIVLLSQHFLSKYSQELKKPRPVLAEESLKLLLQYAWPGNVRELESMMKRAVLLSKSNVINPAFLQQEMQPLLKSENTHSQLQLALLPEDPTAFEGELYRHVIEKTEKALIMQTQAWCKGNLTKTAKLLGISRAMLYERMQKFGLSGMHDHH
jgi:DNA-binding NtrC family response regulator